MDFRDQGTELAASRVELTVVLPAFEEYENLVSLLPRIADNLGDWESTRIVAVVERSSPDEEAKKLSQLGAQVVRREPGESFGDAMRTGFASSSPLSEWVLVMDADGSHDPASIPRLRQAAVSSGADIVIASRYVRGGGSANSLPLYFMSRLLNKSYSLVLGIRARDLSTNYKLYRAEILRGMELTCQNFDVVEEILVRAHQRRPTLKVVEIPDYFHERMYGDSKRHLGPFVVSYLITLARLRWQTRTSRGTRG